MTGPQIGLVLSAFTACAVEAVEAFTIVLAVGTSRDWRSALAGLGAAVIALAVITAMLGPAIGALPLGPVRVIVGLLMLALGAQWLRKAVLRASGRKALRDECAAFIRESVAAADAAPARRRIDAYSFSVAFKGAFLEGLEVVVIVVTFGSAQHDVPLAAAAAAMAVLAVAALGWMLRAPLARVPENAMKFAVGVLLTAFGVFWVGEGAHLHWPGGEAILLALVAAVLAAAATAVRLLHSADPSVV